MSARCGIFNSLLYRRNVVLGNRAAKNIVDEFELAAAHQRLHLDLAIAVLTVSAGLLLMPALHVGLTANRFAIRNFWRLQNYFRVIPLLQLRDHDFNVLLPRARDEEFLSLRIAKESQHRIFFH